MDPSHPGPVPGSEPARGGAGDCGGYGGLSLGLVTAGSSAVVEAMWPVEMDCRVVFWARWAGWLN